MNGAAKEALRQQMLLRALLGDARPAVVGGWLRACGCLKNLLRKH